MRLLESGVSNVATLGIYEKALPKHISWPERLQMTKDLGFDFIEMSIDETDERLARLDWTEEEIREVQNAMNETGIPIVSICLSGHRRYPFGSQDSELRAKAKEVMEKGVDLAARLGIRTIQLAGYDVYYEDKSVITREYFLEGLRAGVEYAASKQIMLSIEIMDDPFINSISKFLEVKKQVASPWLQVYPDLGNLSAWPENNVVTEFEKGIDHITAVHIKDTLAVTNTFEGKFKEVPFGDGCVDFLGCFKTLKRLGYEGSFLIEMWSETSDTPEIEIKKAKAFLLPIMKEAGYEFK